ncbi:hypothetical protein KIN20_005463 [Parelaphostrongylus tenuis]|uniref:Uncharacterized protein n=1 Tax=Parelaphostrongylus tenuis TaxID=148309 RepID=A0AAD5QIL3_PARTN|nr:hypothetical protein KIN20_005463 [Parelaphostrongylus tenuis]
MYIFKELRRVFDSHFANNESTCYHYTRALIPYNQKEWEQIIGLCGVVIARAPNNDERQGISSDFSYKVLEIQNSSGFDDLGGVKPSMAVCLAFVFVLVYFALWKGPKSSGKMVWITATAPYVVLSILLIRGVTLPGASKGLYYYLTPDFSKLSDPKVVGDHDASLIFIVYPQALATMEYSSVWSFIFFAMLISLGIDSTFAGIEALITGVCDEWRFLQRKREWFVGVVCTLYYFGSIPAISYGGQYVIPFLDEYGVSLSVLFIVTCEMVAVCWFYGIDRFSNDIKTMLGFYPGIYWRICWMMCPVFISVIFVMTVWQASLLPMHILDYTFPKWSVGLGWFLRMLSITSVPLFAIYMLSFAKGTLPERLRWATTPQTRRISSISLSAVPTQIIDSTMLHPIHTLTQA